MASGIRDALPPAKPAHRPRAERRAIDPTPPQLDQIIGVRARTMAASYQFAVQRRDPINEGGMQLRAVGPMESPRPSLPAHRRRQGSDYRRFRSEAARSTLYQDIAEQWNRGKPRCTAHADEQPRLFFCQFLGHDDADGSWRRVCARRSTRWGPVELSARSFPETLPSLAAVALMLAARVRHGILLFAMQEGVEIMSARTFSQAVLCVL